MNNEHHYKMPFYVKMAFVFISLFAMALTLSIARGLIVPFVYALILAILLNPLVNYLVKKKINRILAITIALIISLLVIGGIVYIISAQVTMFSDTYPQLKLKFNKTSAELLQWISVKFKIRHSAINAWINQSEKEFINNFAITEKLSAAGHIITTLLLLPVYLIMILYYKNLLLEFIKRLFRLEHHISVNEVLAGIKQIIQTYLVGLFFEMIIVAILNSAGLLLLGIDYAIILGISGALLNIIPFIGGVIAIALPMIIAFVTKETSTYPILVFIIYICIQFIDNHYIIPKIVASRVKLNALVSVIVVLVGGALWGIPGMFLSIPLTAILKVICDHVDILKPWGFLLGNIVPTVSKPLLRKRKKIVITPAA